MTEEVTVKPKRVLPPMTPDLFTKYTDSKVGRFLAENPDMYKKIYGHREMVEDLEPYTLLPKDEISKILKMAWQLILINSTLGREVHLFRFGIFARKWLPPTNVFKPMKDNFDWYPGRHVLKFTPYPYTRWFLSPYVLFKESCKRLGAAYAFLDKVKREMWASHDKYPLVDVLTPDIEDERVLSGYNAAKKRVGRPFSSYK